MENEGLERKAEKKRTDDKHRGVKKNEAALLVKDLILDIESAFLYIHLPSAFIVLRVSAVSLCSFL